MNIPVTEWFPAEVKPVHVGCYQRRYGSPFQINQPDYWNGEEWILLDSYGRAIGDAQSAMPWRGLTSPHPEWKP